MKLEKVSSQPGIPSRVMLACLPIAAIAIVAACWWKLNEQRPVRTADNDPPRMAPAPGFELPDQDSRTLRLERYLHRHPVFLVFFAGEVGEDRWLKMLAERYATVTSTGTKVVAIGQALPSVNRQAKLPFDVLTDLVPGNAGSAGNVHREWGAIDAEGKTVPSVFLITSGRLVEWGDSRPKPLGDPTRVIRALLQGRDPESAL